MITFKDVIKYYAGAKTPSLKDINLNIQKGEFIFLIGASGSGKSTLLRLILREERLTQGNIYILGYNLKTLSNRKLPYYRRNIGIVFQDFRLLPNKTAFENIAFACEVTSMPSSLIKTAVLNALDLVGLKEKQNAYPNELSGGQQQRVAIARAVVIKPKILLADEPTGNLDPKTSKEIMQVLKRINQSGTTVIMATHDAQTVNDLKKRVIALKSGRIISDMNLGTYNLDEISTIAAKSAAKISENNAESEITPPPPPFSPKGSI